MTNLLKSIINIKNFNNTDLNEIYPPGSEMKEINRIQNVGIALEFYIKDSFCDSYDIIDKDEIYNRFFSLLGNKNNPPDFIIRNNDAIEVKQQKNFGKIQLNSSYPHSKLYSTSSLITEECRDCEDGWTEKDVIYAIGYVIDKKIEALFMIYGDCFAARPRFYEEKKNLITESLSEIEQDPPKTNEIYRMNRVDPLGITDLRVRGMWLLTHPKKVFPRLFNPISSSFSLFALMKEEKYDSFPSADKEMIENDSLIQINDVEIKNPNNPANFLTAKFIRYDKI